MGWMVNATPRPLYPRERPGTYCVGGWVGPAVGTNGCGKSHPPPRPGFDLRTAQAVESQYTDYAIPTHLLTTWGSLNSLRTALNVNCALWFVFLYGKGKGKAIPLQTWTGPEGSKFQDNRHMKVLRLSALRTGLLYPQEMFLVLISVVESAPEP
jgi:hypothetical protein